MYIYQTLQPFSTVLPFLKSVPLITATAHKLARIFYHLWTTGDAYVDMGVDAYEQKHQQRVVKNLKRRAKEMGFELVPQPDAG